MAGDPPCAMQFISINDKGVCPGGVVDGAVAGRRLRSDQETAGYPFALPAGGWTTKSADG